MQSKAKSITLQHLKLHITVSTGVSLAAQLVKNSACLGSVPGLGRSPGWGHGNPLKSSCLRNPQGQRSLAGCSPWGRKQLDMTEWLSTAQGTMSRVFLLHCFGRCHFQSDAMPWNRNISLKIKQFNHEKMNMSLTIISMKNLFHIVNEWQNPPSLRHLSFKLSFKKKFGLNSNTTCKNYSVSESYYKKHLST